MTKKESNTESTDRLVQYRAALNDFVLSKAFAQDPKRAQRFSVEAAGLYIDLSKNLIDDRALSLLCDWAHTQKVALRRDALFAGGAVNMSENKPALHTALREDPPRPEVAKTLNQMESLSKSWRAGGRIRDVVHIGIGGSVLGPRLICEALCPQRNGPRIHFVSNIDPKDMEEVLCDCVPETTAFIVASKSFTTPEVLFCVAAAKAFAPNAPMCAATGNAKAAQDFGIAPDHILGVPPWVGGRYSLWGSVGLCLALQNGFDVFRTFLSGARAMDDHFCAEPFENNAPVLLALISVWYRTFWKRPAAAIIPYAHGLRSLPEYVQQLEMESNGKGVDLEGLPVKGPTAPVIFGGVGTNAQHAIGQRLHQGPDFVPVDFVVSAAGENALAASALAQAQALMEGAEVPDNPHRACPGGRPSTTIVMPDLEPRALGALLALYEHKVFVESVLWNINAFDQWGVELGKTLAGPMHSFLMGQENMDILDSSTRALIEKILQFKAHVK